MMRGIKVVGCNNLNAMTPKNPKKTTFSSVRTSTITRNPMTNMLMSTKSSTAFRLPGGTSRTTIPPSVTLGDLSDRNSTFNETGLNITDTAEPEPEAPMSEWTIISFSILIPMAVLFIGGNLYWCQYRRHQRAGGRFTYGVIPYTQVYTQFGLQRIYGFLGKKGEEPQDWGINLPKFNNPAYTNTTGDDVPSTSGTQQPVPENLGDISLENNSSSEDTSSLMSSISGHSSDMEVYSRMMGPNGMLNIPPSNPSKPNKKKIRGKKDKKGMIENILEWSPSEMFANIYNYAEAEHLRARQTKSSGEVTIV